jgi:hypothetical protein
MHRIFNSQAARSRLQSRVGLGCSAGVRVFQPQVATMASSRSKRSYGFLGGVRYSREMGRRGVVEAQVKVESKRA